MPRNPKTTEPRGFRLETNGSGDLVAHGVLDFANARDALRQGEQVLEPGRDGRLDLSELDRVDSAGLAVIIEWLSWYESAGTRLALDAVPEQLRDLARISELEDLLGMSGA